MKIFTILRSLINDTKGVAAVEFAIGAPVMLAAMILMTDVGLALNQRMSLDQAVRAGAEFVMGDVDDVADLEKLLVGAATGAYDAQQPDVTQAGLASVDAVRSCLCPDGTVPLTCNTLCVADQVPPSIYYQLTLSKTYDALVLPDFDLASQITVQVR